MRLILLHLIIFFCFSCLSFGQDSLQIDTTLKTSTSTTQDNVLADSVSATLKNFPGNKKKQRKKVQKFKAKEEPVFSNDENTENVNASGKDNWLIIVGLIIIAVIIVLAYYRSTFAANDKHRTTSSKDDEFLSDYISRILLPRREYYRNVYLKSEAWKRKRYLVLKRDNWRCVYCGGKATQVHHTRYAKRNIGKEPIEWLVSICKNCHDSKH
jgi:HNH endonuclease